MKLELKTNRHPNVDRSPWGWIQIEGTRIEIATWSGENEKALWKRIIKENPFEKNTTVEQLLKYGEELMNHDARMEREKPVPPPNFENIEDDQESKRYYESLLSQYYMMCSCDAPNKPGYFRANND